MGSVSTCWDSDPAISIGREPKPLPQHITRADPVVAQDVKLPVASSGFWKPNTNWACAAGAAAVAAAAVTMSATSARTILAHVPPLTPDVTGP